MSKAVKLFNAVCKDEEGAALVEYGLLVGLIALVCVTAVTNLGSTVKTLFTNIASSLYTEEERTEPGNIGCIPRLTKGSEFEIQSSRYFTPVIGE